SLSLPFLFPRARSAQADADAAALVRAELPRVERLLGRMLGPRGDLDDLVQSVFVEACRAFAHYRGEGSPGAFIGGIAVQVARRAMRGSAFSRHRAELADEPPSAAGDPEEAYARAQWMRRVRHALEQIAPKKRIAFALWALEGLEVTEVATLMGASVAATRSRVFYAQRELRQLAARDPILREALGDEP
ncbi:MAG TPA: sigma-70 family RNA polymerase sigma factor, partial [Polyangiales bacterium]